MHLKSTIINILCQWVYCRFIIILIAKLKDDSHIVIFLCFIYLSFYLQNERISLYKLSF